jgi:hypothetical protein
MSVSLPAFTRRRVDASVREHDAKPPLLTDLEAQAGRAAARGVEQEVGVCRHVAVDPDAAAL